MHCLKCHWGLSESEHTGELQLCNRCANLVAVAKLAPAIRGGYEEAARNAIRRMYGWRKPLTRRTVLPAAS